METENVPQSRPKNAEPQKEHLWLQRLLGEWIMVADSTRSDEAPAERSLPTETVRPMGRTWIVAEGSEGQGDEKMQWMITLGYDPVRARFVGTWIGTMMPQLWVCEGTLDESGTTLTLDCQGPSMAGDGTMANYRDVIGLPGNDRRTLTAFVETPDGQWQQFMHVEYRRK